MQKVCNIIPFFLSRLSGIAPQREIRNWAYLSIEKIIGLNRLVSNPNCERKNIKKNKKINIIIIEINKYFRILVI